MGAWFIDALDSRAGLAFVSHRSADLLGSDQDIDNNAVHIGPPHFRPETVASRAIGMAATRGSFQTGLFFEEREVGFDTLEDAIEFVRRTYVSGGGGDGAGGGGGGGGGVPPRPPDGPDDEDRPRPGREKSAPGETGRESGRPVIALREAFASAGEEARIELLGPAAAGSEGAMALARAQAPDYGDPGDGGEESGPIMAEAAALVAAELIARAPPHGTDAATVSHWWNAVSSVRAAIDHADLWTALASGSAGTILGEAGKRLTGKRYAWLFGDHAINRRLRPGAPVTDDLGLALAIAVLTGWNTRFRYDLWDDLAYWLDHLRQGYRLALAAHRRDRFEQLAKWPLDSQLCGIAGLPAEVSSVADLLSLATGAPHAVEPFTPQVAGLLLFGAFYLVVEEEGPLSHRYYSTLPEAWRSAGIARAVKWLSQQFPKRAFPPEIEAMFEQPQRRLHA